MLLCVFGLFATVVLINQDNPGFTTTRANDRRLTVYQIVMTCYYILGAERFLRDIELMIGYRPTILWAYAWKFLSPLIILVSKNST